MAFRAVANGSVDFLAQSRAAIVNIREPESLYVTASARNCTPLPRTRGGFGLSVCRRNSPPRLCHGHAPAALWSHPGSGNTWLRLVIELASGGRTGSIYSRKRRRCTGQAVLEDDAQTLLGRPARRCQWGHRLAAKMPSEFWPHRTRQDCASMVAMKVHSRRGWHHLSTSQQHSSGTTQMASPPALQSEYFYLFVKYHTSPK